MYTSDINRYFLVRQHSADSNKYWNQLSKVSSLIIFTLKCIIIIVIFDSHYNFIKVSKPAGQSFRQTRTQKGGSKLTEGGGGIVIESREW